MTARGAGQGCWEADRVRVLERALRLARMELRRIRPNVYGALDRINDVLTEAAAPSSTADGRTG